MRISDWSSDVCSSDLITVACVGRAGRAKHDAAQSLLEDYRVRLPWPVTVKEVEDSKQGGSTAERQSSEGELLLAALPKGAVNTELDEQERGRGTRRETVVHDG